MEEERKAKLREQQEMEKKMAEEMQEVPEWKREIMMKRGGAIRNWADEREEKNEQVDNQSLTYCAFALGMSTAVRCVCVIDSHWFGAYLTAWFLENTDYVCRMFWQQ